MTAAMVLALLGCGRWGGRFFLPGTGAGETDWAEEDFFRLCFFPTRS